MAKAKVTGTEAAQGGAPGAAKGPPGGRVTQAVADELARKKYQSSGIDDGYAKTLGFTAEASGNKARLHIPYFDMDGAPVVAERADGKGFQKRTYFYRDRWLRDEKRGVLPPTDEKGEERRYVQPGGTRPFAYFARGGVQGRSWRDISADTSILIAITEGELKAACACDRGFVTIALGGVNAYLSKKWKLQFLPELDAITWAGRHVVIVFDSDSAFKTQVRHALVDLAQKLRDRGAEVREAEIPHDENGEKQGLDDFIVTEGEAAYRRILEGAGEVEDIDMPERSTVATILDVLHGAWGIRDEVLRGALEYDALKNVPVLDRRPFDVDTAVFQLRAAAARKNPKWNFNKGDTWDALLTVAKERTYHPVADYLRGLAPWDGSDWIGQSVQKVLKLPASDKLSPVLWRKFLISAAARAMEPGCKVDTTLVLVGPQGRMRKSTLFEVLAGGPQFFGDTAVDLRDKDAYLNMHETWIYEWGELETKRRTAAISAVKGFLAARANRVRAPYERKAELMLRSFVVVGTTNEQEFLADPSGARRYWPVRVPDDTYAADGIEWLRKNRDALWAQAFAAYRAGEAWWLADDSPEEKLLAERHEGHRVVDDLEDVVVAYLESKSPVGATSQELCEHAFGAHLGTGQKVWPPREQARLNAALRTHGYVNRRWQFDGIRTQRLWRHLLWPAPKRGVAAHDGASGKLLTMPTGPKARKF